MPPEFRADAHRAAIRVAPVVAAADRSNGYLDVAGWLASLGGDERRIAAVRAAMDRARASMSAMTDAQKQLGTWPFAGPWREWDPAREMEHFERFVQ
jgi:hypothetical protein